VLREVATSRQRLLPAPSALRNGVARSGQGILPAGAQRTLHGPKPPERPPRALPRREPTMRSCRMLLPGTEGSPSWLSADGTESGRSMRGAPDTGRSLATGIRVARIPPAACGRFPFLGLTSGAPPRAAVASPPRLLRKQPNGTRAAPSFAPQTTPSRTAPRRLPRKQALTRGPPSFAPQTSSDARPALVCPANNL
jgi:hypothetical protein